MITGKTLTDLGYVPGPWFKKAITDAELIRVSGGDEAAIIEAIEAHRPTIVSAVPLNNSGSLAYHLNIRADTGDEIDNIASVERHMAELMRVPTVRDGAVMPDACSAGQAPGTIPVGGIVATENAIHPGMHSADICCSMAVTIFANEVDPTSVIDAGMRLSHFGGGGRPRVAQMRPSDAILAAFDGNAFLKPHTSAAIEHHATQGDGNHFFYVGRVASTGKLALVTHHGSRKPGAMLYRSGMAVAEKSTRRLSPETPSHNSWIVADSDDGREYWAALQIVREWTKSNHYALHDMVMADLGLKASDRFWNEHNFVFRKSNGLFYHGKGATPAWSDYASDANGLTLIPLNMAEPILIARGLNAPNGLGFSPHGAGRNMSRTAYMRRNAGKTNIEMMAEQTQGIDARFFCGIPDASELPMAYKNAASMRAQITDYGLAEIVDTIDPIGCIMAGEWDRNAPWKLKAAAKRAART